MKSLSFSSLLRVLLMVAFSSHLIAQDYAEYARGAGIARRRNNNGPVIMAAAAGIFGGVCGWLICGNQMKTKFDREKKDLVQYIQLQNEVFRDREKQWQQEYNKAFKKLQELETETMERDYEEFKAPDTNNDDIISRSEFNTYVKKYLSSFPELSEKDFPKFDDFDLDGDGQVSFDEWQQFLVIQKQQEAAKKKTDGKKGNSQYDDMMNALYDSTAKADSFNSVSKNMQTGARGRRA